MPKSAHVFFDSLSREWRSKYLLFGVCVMVCVNAILRHYQMAIQPQCVPGEDCSFYTAMTQAFITHHMTTVQFPFSQRIFQPYLASLLPFDNVTLSFYVMNWVTFNIAILLLITLWMRLNVPLMLIFFAVLWLAFNPAGIKCYFTYVVNTDVMEYLFNAMLLWTIFSRRYYFLALISPFAVLEKESFISTLLIIFLCEGFRFFKEEEYKPLVWSGLAVAIGITVNHFTNTHLFYPGQGSSFSTLMFWAHARITHPFVLLQWLYVCVIALGGFPLLLKYASLADVKNHIFIVLSLISLSYFGFGLLAGTDISRIVFDGSPFMMTVFLSLVANKKVSGCVVVVVFLLSFYLLHQAQMIAAPEHIYFHVMRLIGAYALSFILMMCCLRYSQASRKKLC